MHTRQSPWFVAFVVVAAIVGAEVGDYIERESRLSFGLFGFIAGLWLVVVIVVLVVIGLATTAFGSKRSGLKVIAVAAALVVGGSVGFTTGSSTGFLTFVTGGEVEPAVVTDAVGSASFDAPISDSFAGRGTCHTFASGDVTAEITGDVGRDTVRVTVVWAEDESQRWVAVTGHLSDQSLAHYITTDATSLELLTDGRSGSVTFDRLELGLRRTPLGGPGGPSSISGAVSWTCLNAGER